jgi:hypothetical protein
MKKKHIEYAIQLSYPAEEYPKLDAFFDTVVGRKHGSSGMGFGRRDMSWYSKSKTMCTRMFNKLKKNLHPGVEVEIYDVKVD